MTFPTDHDIETAREAFQGMQDSITLANEGIEHVLTCPVLRAYPIDGYNKRCSVENAEGIAYRSRASGPSPAPMIEVYPYDGPETIVLSCGYAEVWSDGTVTGGPVAFRVDCDGLIED